MGHLLSILLLPVEVVQCVVDFAVALCFSLLAGFYGGGLRGSWASLLRMLQRSPVVREDGIVLSSPYKVGGIRLPPFTGTSEIEWKERLERLSKFEAREDDIFIVSYPKCGHHFTHEILTMLMSGKLQLNLKDKGSRFLEFFRWPQEYFEKMASPRIILTHLPLNLMPKSILQKQCRILRVSRNPKDVIVSYFHHLKTIKFYYYDASFDNFFKMVMDGEAEYGDYLDYERQYVDGLPNLNHVLHITFEDLKLKSSATIKEIGIFLGLDYADEFYDQVAIATEFSKVKSVKEKDLIWKFVGKSGKSLYRKGVVGDWKNHLTISQNQLMDERIYQEWSGTKLVDLFNYGDSL